MTDDLTAGEFQAMTGLSAKALRLYAERGIMAPAWVDPRSGYRWYARSQLQHGVTVDLLRRAQVPLTELTDAATFAFDRWRETVALRRQFEDFYLDVAERVGSFRADDYVAHGTPAAALDWIGVIIDLAIPEDAEGRLQTFAGLSLDIPGIEAALTDALAELGVAPATAAWTAVPDTGIANAANQMLLARTAPAGLGVTALARIEAHVRATTGQAVTAVSGTLPSRIEVTFTAASAAEPSPVQEAAEGYLHLLAFEHHLVRNDLTALRPTARQVVGGPSLFAGQDPVGTFDVTSPSHPA
jgi:hypothetical protein